MMNSELYSSLLPILLLSGISLNLLSLAKQSSSERARRPPSFQAINLSITFPIIALIAPHYYHGFDLNLVHYLEHSALKTLLALAAINVVLFQGTKIHSLQPKEPFPRSGKASSGVSEIDDNLEQVDETVEPDIFNRELYRLSSRATQFIEKVSQLSSSIDLYTAFEHMPHHVENVLYPIERNANGLWTALVKKSERIPHTLSRIQTGLLSNNLILIMGFLLLFILLLLITPGG